MKYKCLSQKMAHNLLVVIFWRGREMPNPSFWCLPQSPAGAGCASMGNPIVKQSEFWELVLKPLVAWNWPSLECLYCGNRSTLQMESFAFVFWRAGFLAHPCASWYQIQNTQQHPDCAPQRSVETLGAWGPSHREPTGWLQTLTISLSCTGCGSSL